MRGFLVIVMLLLVTGCTAADAPTVAPEVDAALERCLELTQSASEESDRITSDGELMTAAIQGEDWAVAQRAYDRIGDGYESLRRLIEELQADCDGRYGDRIDRIADAGALMLPLWGQMQQACREDEALVAAGIRC